MNTKNNVPKSLLVTRFSALGDVALTIPPLYDLCKAYPDVKIVFLTRKGWDSFFLERPDNLVIEAVNLDEYKGVGGMWRLFKEMRRRHGIDAYADLHDVLRTKMLRFFAHLSRIPVAHIDKGRAEKKRLTRTKDKHLVPLRHSTRRYLDTFEKLGLKPAEAFDGFFKSAPADPAVYAAITEPRAEGETWIGIAPFAKHQGKIYPTSLMEQVVRELSERSGYRIFLFGGGPYENKILSEWAHKYPGVTSLAGRRLGMNIEISLMSELDVMVAMDSANMHLAALAGVPVVSIWGATHPYTGFAGWRTDSGLWVQLPVPCRPCSVFGNKPCAYGDYRCMARIKPSLIISTIDSVLSPRKNQ